MNASHSAAPSTISRPLKYVAPMRGEKVDGVPEDAEFLGLEQFESWTGRLVATESEQHPEGGANAFLPGDVLFGKLRPYLAKAWVADRSGYCTTEALVLKPRDVEARFLRYHLLTPLVISAIAGSTYGSKMPRADWSFIGALKLTLPPRREQERIANFLDEKTARIDALVAEKERLATVITNSTADVMHHFITKGVRKAVLSESGRIWIGKCPAHWSAPYIRFVARLESGHTPSRQHPEYWADCSIPWFTLGDVWQIRDGDVEVVKETAELISELGIQNSAARLLPVGTVMLSRTASVGFSAIMGVPMATTQDFVNWVCGPKLLPEYLLYAFRVMRTEFDRLKFGSTHQTIYMPDVAKLSTPLPPLGEQEEIVRVVREKKARLDQLRREALAAVDALREYRSSLISAAVTGQFVVPG